MKISLKLQDQHSHGEGCCQPPPLLLRAKIPVTIFNLPFLSHFSTTTAHPSDISLSLSTNFPSFPSLKLAYAATAASTSPLLTVTLKSGSGLFGSPKNSPLVISAHFSFNPSNPNPTFSLLLKPRLGSFSLRKSTSSHPEEPPTGFDSTTSSMGFVPLESPPSPAKDLPVEKFRGNCSILRKMQLAARTLMPVSNRAELSFRWRVNFAANQMPVLRINKIGIQRVDFGGGNNDNDDNDYDVQNRKTKGGQGNSGELEVLKGMFFWMKNELDALSRANSEMKRELGEMKTGRTGRVDMLHCVDNSSSSSAELEQWRSKRKGRGEREESGKKEDKKSEVCVANDVESELQRAIQAAASAASQ
ncbi:AMP-dependent synthetase and ligase family protein [Striga asiatica]|uniref:AMP-dependent synthetase and ligase family protein n=1 Tax=Striga asiatica TaxID=4170 RepID=A0A5A7PSE1_STRAF|nr:AMP-dependent synthetase and ligase family protein [Striga asiatica]